MRRLWLVPLLALLFCGVGLARVAKAHSPRAHKAATLTGPAANSYNSWLAVDGMPQPKGSINVVQAPGTSVAQVDPDGTATITMGDNTKDRGTFYHELGHVFDNRNLSDIARIRFRAIMHDQRPYGQQGAAHAGEPNPPREQFAEAYRLLALHPWAAQSQRGFRRLLKFENRTGYTGGGYPIRRAEQGYDFKPTYWQLRKIANLIQSAG